MSRFELQRAGVLDDALPALGPEPGQVLLPSETEGANDEPARLDDVPGGLVDHREVDERQREEIGA